MILIVDDYLFLAGGLIAAAWGLAHLLPIRAFKDKFGDAKKPRLPASWAAEGLSLILIGGMVCFAVAVTGTENNGTRAVTWSAAATMFVFAIVNLFTGVRTSRAPLKLSAVIDGMAGALLLMGSIVNS
jgi:hypothetical protein